MNTTETSHKIADRRTAIVFGFLTLAFVLRVIGQAVQLWLPVGFLPPFDDWQGSSLPYPILLGAQILIILIAGWVIRRMWLGAKLIPPRLIIPVLVLGMVYFGGMAMRILMGLTLFPESDWFTSWISSALHLVLAVQVVMIGVYQHRKSRAHESR